MVFSRPKSSLLWVTIHFSQTHLLGGVPQTRPSHFPVVPSRLSYKKKSGLKSLLSQELNLGMEWMHPKQSGTQVCPIKAFL